MADPTTVFRISAVVEGSDKVEALKQTIRLLANSTTPASDAVDELRQKALELGTASNASTKNLKDSISSLRDLRDQVKLGSKAYQDMGRDLEFLQGRLNAATGSMRQFAQAQTAAAKNPFSLSGAGKTRGQTQYQQPAGPMQLDYGAVTQNLGALEAALDQFDSAKRQSRLNQLETNERFNNLEIDQFNKFAKAELKAQKQADRDLLDDFDRRLENRGKAREASRKRFANFGQSAGAIAASGVFGGPEGAIGAGIGAMFGPGAALGGGAIGAQVGMFRKQLGDTADYAASIQRLEIALKGVTKTQSAYEQALAASARVTKEFNIPQFEATKNLTRLTASVIGAGGKVADAEVVFRNVTAAIKATGGGAEEVNGAMTAFSQIFSKGKLSAEEINQIAERLPGTFTMIAKAAGKTGPELSKALEQGTVGLDTVMKFVVGLGGTYGKAAADVAKSNADAGARLTTTWTNVRKEIGDALMPLGAEIQNSLGTLLIGLTPLLSGAAEAITSTFGAIGAAFKAFDSLPAPVKALAEGLVIATSAVVGFNLAVAAAKGIASFALSLDLLTKGLALAKNAQLALNLAVLANPYVAAAAGIAALTIAAYKLNKPFKDFVDSIPGRLSAFFGSLYSDGKKSIESVGKFFTDLGNKTRAIVASISSRFGFLKPFFGGISKFMSDAFKGSFEYIQKNLGITIRRLISQVAPWVDLLRLIPGAEKAVKAAVSYRTGEQKLTDLGVSQTYKDAQGNVYSTVTGKMIQPAKAAKEALTDFPDPSSKAKGDSEGDKEAERAARDAETLAARNQQLAEDYAKQQIRLADDVFQHQIELDRKRYELNQELIDLQRNNFLGELTGSGKEYASAVIDLKRNLEGLDKRSIDANLEVRKAKQAASSAEQMAAVTTDSGNSATLSNAGNGFISKEVLRKWLISQGMSRTSGDFTNSGHKTPNHMLNAMDMGFVGSQYDHNYVQKTIEVERKLRATNAFGSQLFGPERDPVGHKSHLHVPTPGGQVKLNPALAALLGLSGGAPTASLNAAQNSQTRRGVKATGSAMLEAQDVTQSIEERTAFEKEKPKLQAEYLAEFYNKITIPTKERIKALDQENQLTQVKNRLQLEGVRPELIDQEEKLVQLENERQQALEKLKLAQDFTKLEGEALDKYNKSLKDTNANFDSLAAKTVNATAAQIAFNDALEKQQKIKDFSGNIASTISGGIGEAFDKLIEGTENWKKSLQDISTNVLKDIAKQLINMFVVEPIKKSFTSMLEGLMGGGKQAMPQLASAIAITPQAAYNTNPTESVGQALDFNAASAGLTAWSSQLPNLAESTTQLTNATQATSQAILNTAQGATQASTGFAGLSQNLGKAMAALAGIGLGAAGAQQMGQGGASNFLGGLGKIFVGAGSLLGGFGGFGGGGGGLASAAQGVNFNPIAFSLPRLAAKGAMFDGQTSRFAMGGIVSRPTLFKFGEGGQLKNGVMGEAGPEAIIPLRRGSNGRLGVEANGLRDAMGPAPTSGSTTPMLNMTFETTKIGGTEYVSREQLESAMAATRRQAAKDGASRGMTMTLSKLQQSPATRSKVGLR